MTEHGRLPQMRGTKLAEKLKYESKSPPAKLHKQNLSVKQQSTPGASPQTVPAHSRNKQVFDYSSFSPEPEEFDPTE